MPTKPPQIPNTLRLERCEFFAPEPSSDGAVTSRPCRMRARSGESIPVPWIGNVVHDLSGMKLLADRINVDYCHNPNELIGYCEDFDVSSGDLQCSALIFSTSQNDRAAEVLARAKAGQPYECSIKWDDGVIEHVEAGATVHVNNREIAGPGIVVRQWTLRGIAVCPYGMDPHTAAEFARLDTFHRGANAAPLAQTQQEAGQMAKGKCEDPQKPADQPAEGAARRRRMSDDAPATTTTPPPDELEDSPGTTTTPPPDELEDAPGTTTTAPPDELEDDGSPEVRQEMSARLRYYVQKFGSELGAKWFADNRSLVKCYGEYVAVLERRHAAELARERKRSDQLAAAVTELQTVITSMGKAGGSPAPVSGKPAASEAPGNKASAKYSDILPPNLARVAAGMNMPQTR